MELKLSQEELSEALNKLFCDWRCEVAGRQQIGWQEKVDFIKNPNNFTFFDFMLWLKAKEDKKKEE